MKKNLRAGIADEKALFLSQRLNKFLIPTDMRTYSSEYQKQWSKLMYNFFDYLPTKLLVQI